MIALATILFICFSSLIFILFYINFNFIIFYKILYFSVVTKVEEMILSN